jgi:hypothetical protein
MISTSRITDPVISIDAPLAPASVNPVGGVVPSVTSFLTKAGYSKALPTAENPTYFPGLPGTDTVGKHQTDCSVTPWSPDCGGPGKTDENKCQRKPWLPECITGKGGGDTGGGGGDTGGKKPPDTGPCFGLPSYIATCIDPCDGTSYQFDAGCFGLTPCPRSKSSCPEGQPVDRNPIDPLPPTKGGGGSTGGGGSAGGGATDSDGGATGIQPVDDTIAKFLSLFGPSLFSSPSQGSQPGGQVVAIPAQQTDSGVPGGLNIKLFLIVGVIVVGGYFGWKYYKKHRG